MSFLFPPPFFSCYPYAVSKFCKNFSSGMKSISLKKTCISLLKTCKSMEELKQIHCQMLRVGLEQNTDAVSKLMTFCTNPASGSLNYAVKVFNFTQAPCLFAYNLMIKAFTKKGSLKRSISLFKKMREDGLCPDNFTYPFVLKAMGGLKDLFLGRQTHGYIIKSGLDFDLYVKNSLMDMYAEMSTIDISQKLFDEMPEKDVFSWNILISGFVKCKRFEEAILVFERMGDLGMRPDEATLVSTLSACSFLRNMELGKEIHMLVSENFNFSTSIGNALLDMYTKCGCLVIAHKLFDEMPIKNVISWTTLVSGYANCGQLNEAHDLFERSPTKDVVLWTAMINGYVQFNHCNEALALFREMQINRVRPDRFTLVSILTVCAHLGALEQGEWIHRYIKNNAIRVDTVLGTALVDMYAKCGYIERSLEIFKEIKGKDTGLWTAIICGLAMNGQSSRALEFFSLMKQNGVKPDDITFIGVLSACTHGGLVEQGCKHFNEMLSHQINPKIEHYSCFADLLGRAGLLGEATKLIMKIPNDNNSLPLWGSLLGACRIHDNAEIGQIVAGWLVNIKSTNLGVHTLLANIYAAANQWEDVRNVRKIMKDFGIRKTPGCSSIEVGGVVSEFLAGDISHPALKEVYLVLNHIASHID